MITFLYVALASLLICQLSMTVIRLRREYQISTGDAGNRELVNAIAAQSNAIEYLPIGLLLLIGIEINTANIILVHVSGILLLAGRVIHAHAMRGNNLKQRVLGMQMTFYTLYALAILNIIYLPWARLTSV